MVYELSISNFGLLHMNRLSPMTLWHDYRDNSARSLLSSRLSRLFFNLERCIMVASPGLFS